MAQREVTGWVGWVYFAGFMMVLSGIFAAIAGLVALFNDKVYIASQNNLWILDYTTWGWAHLLLGILIAAAGMAVMNGQVWGRSIGVILVLISAVANFAFIPVYPIWSIIILTVDALVLYALIAHGSEAREY